MIRRSGRARGRRTRAAPVTSTRGDVATCLDGLRRGFPGWSHLEPTANRERGIGHNPPSTLPPWAMFAAEVSAVRIGDVQRAFVVAPCGEVLGEVAKWPNLPNWELSRPPNHEPTGRLPGERDLHVGRLHFITIRGFPTASSPWVPRHRRQIKPNDLRSQAAGRRPECSLTIWTDRSRVRILCPWSGRGDAGRTV